LLNFFAPEKQTKVRSIKSGISTIFVMMFIRFFGRKPCITTAAVLCVNRDATDHVGGKCLYQDAANTFLNW